ncbi:MAG TPA: tRNA lysidine(34) synthetase TilS [Pseudomonadales bacterium]|nr:tRNA lysidine(34) synthetase TilS [Pseudomonadales bacterium]
MTPAASDGGALDALHAALDGALTGIEAARCLVAVSGGRDSMLLLHLLAARHRAAGVAPPRVVHVHHGLQRDADAWAEQVEAACAALACPCVVRRVRVVAGGEGPEAAARGARYAAFESVMAAGDHLLTAHHRDDQAETVLLRLLRGAGPRGLAGMRPRRTLGTGVLVRPLLEVEGTVLAAAARALNLSWVEDPSNAGLDADRNLLRHEILPRLDARWPGAARSLARAARACGDQEALLDELLTEVPAAGAPLPVATLAGDAPRGHAVLRRWLAGAGVPMPPRTRLDELLRQLAAPVDARVRIDLGAWSIRRFRGALHLLTAMPAPRVPAALQVPGETDLGCGRLRLDLDATGGLRTDLGPPQVRFRRGGERVRPSGRGGSVALKQWLQEEGVPPWQRDRLPLLLLGGEVAAVGERLLDDGLQTPPDVPGWRPRWLPSAS